MTLHKLGAALALVIGTSAFAQTAPATLPVPDEATIPAGPMGDAIKRGKLILTDTKRQLPHNVGNGLNCTSCHLNGGTTP
jgi:thiosulfate dehydrogenase